MKKFNQTDFQIDVLEIKHFLEKECDPNFIHIVTECDIKTWETYFDKPKIHIMLITNDACKDKGNKLVFAREALIKQALLKSRKELERYSISITEVHPDYFQPSLLQAAEEDVRAVINPINYFLQASTFN